MKTSVFARTKGLCLQADGFLTRRLRLSGAALAVLICAAFAAFSVVGGPLYNLNDIGTFRLRALFILMVSAMHGVVLLAATFLHRGGFSRLALRQLLLTAGLFILLQGVNQKTYVYIETVQPLIRAMDAQGLGAMAGFETNLSAPAMTLLYALTRLPIYDMYLVKLLSIAGLMTLCVLALFAADKLRLGLRAEVALALCLILPQGFMNAACSALLDVPAVALLAVSLALCCGDAPSPARMTASALCFGAAAALSGFALYALPLFLWLVFKKRMKPAQLAAALAVVALLCLPALLSGVPLAETAASLLRANFALPQYAAGSPSVLSFIPRAIPQEMPEYFMLRRLPEIDVQTYAQPFYTQAHFMQVTRGVTLAALALLMGLYAVILRKKDLSPLARAFALTLAALLCCPGVTSGAWVLLDVLAVLVLLAAPKLRLPACLTLFATAGASCYPLTEEILLPMILAMALCLAALALTLDFFPRADEPSPETTDETKENRT